MLCLASTVLAAPKGGLELTTQKFGAWEASGKCLTFNSGEISGVITSLRNVDSNGNEFTFAMTRTHVCGGRRIDASLSIKTQLDIKMNIPICTEAIYEFSGNITVRESTISTIFPVSDGQYLILFDSDRIMSLLNDENINLKITIPYINKQFLYSVNNTELIEAMAYIYEWAAPIFENLK